MTRLPSERILSILATCLIGVVGVTTPAIAQSEDYHASTYSLNDFGGIGLLETRTARFAPDGEFDVGVSLVNPHRRYFLNWQILPGVEVTFRYVDFTNTTFGPNGGIELRPSVSDREFFKSLFTGIPGPDILGRQFDVKFLLRRESEYLPQIAMGFQDFVGTGESGGEYIVGSKRFHDLDFTLGIGWGYFAGHKAFKNPMRLLSSKFRTRNADTTLGGTFNYKNFFAGEHVGIFGGIEYATPVRGLTLKAEYNSATNLTPLGADPEFSTFPIGIALNYRPINAFEVSVGLERGDTIMVRAALRSDLHAESGIPKFDPELPPMYVRPETRGLGLDENGQMLAPEIADLIDRIFDDLTVNGISVEAVSVDPDRLRIEVGRLSPQQVEVVRRAAANSVMKFPDEIMEVTFEQVGVAQDLTWSIADLVEVFARAALVETFSNRSAPLSSVTVGNSVVHVELLSSLSDVENSDWKSAVGAMLVRLPHQIDTIHVKDAKGLGFTVDRGVVERQMSADRLFDLASDMGARITELQFTDGEALIEVATTYSADREYYQKMASEMAVALGGDVSVTLIGYDGDRQITHFLERPNGGSGEHFGADQKSPMRHVPVRAIEHLDHKAIAKAVFTDLDNYGFRGQSLLIEDREVVLYLDEAPYLQEARNAAWIAHILSAHLPRETEKITLARMAHGIEVSRMSFFRSDVERMAMGLGSIEEIWAHSANGTVMGRPVDDLAIQNDDSFPIFDWAIGPSMRTHIGAPEGIIFVDVIAALSASLRITPAFTLRGEYGQFLFGNINKLEQTAPSALKPVRSLILDYQQQGRSAIHVLEADYLFSLAPNLVARVGVGLFEQMYGGVGGEVYYHQPNTRWAVGANLYWLKQREFSGGLGFRDLSTTTGHVSLYYDLPLYDLHARVDAGRYLAGDWGATFDLSREFRSGVTVGAFATFTNVSAEDFGEGRFDRGFYMRFPLELFTLRSAASFESFLFRPVSRDGGQMLHNASRLPEIVRKGEALDYRKSWHRFGS